ncbi:hypothetical protein CKO_02802 [Citrobacter koseri ATCC BAA-895]|uniref:Uncharacterized protein n=1 Tax=Citrobacter koseri (strain ATCC BAA-895 / CDC 4225-83 / SGSC4696) TaxID=290338 RepID=A8AK95_CITK8|nr:hypothetical protein CKO_02802 [Citrobacter koseri ATCC BAA-895]
MRTKLANTGHNARFPSRFCWVRPVLSRSALRQKHSSRHNDKKLAGEHHV